MLDEETGFFCDKNVENMKITKINFFEVCNV